jgi:hypothetical protein
MYGRTWVSFTSLLFVPDIPDAPPAIIIDSSHWQHLQYRIQYRKRVLAKHCVPLGYALHECLSSFFDLAVQPNHQSPQLDFQVVLPLPSVEVPLAISLQRMNEALPWHFLHLVPFSVSMVQTMKFYHHYSLLTSSGPAIGPIIGGYITQVLGVKWLFIIIGCKSLAASFWHPKAHFTQ